jgi:excisionase family DNA binding protein
MSARSRRNRDPALIGDLIAHGRAQADEFALRFRLARRLGPVAAIGGRRARCRRVDRLRPVTQSGKHLGPASPVSGCRKLWWQWTTRLRLVMNDVSKDARPDLILAGGQDVDGPLGPLAAYLRALEARVAALERRGSAVPLMRSADAARYAQVNVETILRAVRAGELPVAGYVGRSPRISRDALNSWLAARSATAAAPVSSQPRRRRGREAGDAVEAAWRALG